MYIKFFKLFIRFFSLSFIYQCLNEHDVENIQIIDKDDKRFKSISPNLININEKEKYDITLNYTYNFKEEEMAK